ncbi:MAG: 50S ribosomal protein L23 [Acidobacteriota bacterium]
MSLKTHQILLGPVITEKTTLLKEKGGELCFRVHTGATKIQVRQAIEAAFDVKVASLRTVRVPGKFKRQGRFGGYRSDWKKAYVTLTSGSRAIEYFEL